jgi:Dullard-like phosphatase family protein
MTNHTIYLIEQSMTLATVWNKELACCSTGNEPSEASSTGPHLPKPFQDVLKLIGTFPSPTPADIQARLVYLGPKTKRYTLFLDLDETLVYSSELLIEGENGDESKLLVYPRPGASEFLKAVSEKYELVVFTAAELSYAQEAVDILDPEQRYIKRILARDSCIRVTTQHLTKDLRIIADRALSDLLIADNDITNFAFQLEHGIPVSSYVGAEEDNELECLQYYLEELYDEPDIIAANRKRMRLVL